MFIKVNYIYFSREVGLSLKPNLWFLWKTGFVKKRKNFSDSSR